jgi:hypothetical protein
MKKRWTMQDLKDRTDLDVLQCLVSERMSELNPYAPLSRRLQQVYTKLDQHAIADKQEKDDALTYMRRIAAERLNTGTDAQARMYMKVAIALYTGSETDHEAANRACREAEYGLPAEKVTA